MTFQFDIISEQEENNLLQETIPQAISHIIIIGLGASTLNTKALLTFIKISKKLIFLDTIEQDIIDELTFNINPATTMIVAISKSGTTDETNLILKYLLTNNFGECITYLVSENKNSPLIKIGSELNINARFYAYESSISGRFAILKSANLLPIHLAGGNIAPYIKEVRDYNNFVGAQELSNNLLKHYEAGRKILILPVYNNKLFGLAEWIRQLVAESLGKNGFGFTPLISKGTIDEHSQLQLYLDGPDDKIYYFLLDNISNNSSSNLELAREKHRKGFLSSLEHSSRPCLNEQEDSIAVICKWLLTVQYIAEFKQVNPFNQPAVDKAKKLFI